MELYRKKLKKELKNFIPQLKMCNKIEKSIFKYSKKYIELNDLDIEYFENIYRDKFDNILENLNCNSSIKNDYLLKAILNNEINLDRIAFLEPYELCPIKWKVIIDRKELVEYKKKNIATTDIYKCYKCNRSKTTYEFKQTRSADEPQTIFIHCEICDHRWRKND